MSEIRVKEGESLESALRRFKRSTAAAVCSQRFVSARLTRSRLLSARRSPKQPASASSSN